MSQTYILGLKIDDLSLTQAITTIAAFLLTGEKGYITTPNPEICLLGFNNKAYRRIHINSLLSIPDGYGLKIGARILSSKLNNTTTGADLCWEVAKLAEQKNYSILFFEGRPPIALAAQNVFKQNFPNLQISYIDPGKVNAEGEAENQHLIEQINAINPDIVLVNFGAPKQEYFINKNMDKLETKLLLGIGGSLDFISGRIKRAPQAWRKLHLEWLWRLIQEPKRWKRIAKAVIVFPLACIYWRICNEFRYRKNVAGFIINDQKKILLAKHARTSEWKLPQGGSKNAKTKEQLEAAILREMKEELGTDKFLIQDMLKNCYKYKFPKNISDWNRDKYTGQRQTLFLLKFIGQDSDIILDLKEHTQWQWVSKEDILNIATPKRQDIIKIGLDKFKQYL